MTHTAPLVCLLTLSLTGFICGQEARTKKPDPFDAIGKDYSTVVLPILNGYCNKCHDEESAKGDLDLERLGTLTEVRKNPRIWQKVVFMLENDEMPPKKSRQLSAKQEKTLLDWAGRYLNAEAHANAGDPGRVVIRRLSNTEFDNTIRDLTGIPLEPTREFPADSAAGEGFTNTGDSMVMSPALFDKYLDAARKIAEHTVFLPDGFRFSDATARRDQTDEIIDRVLALYASRTDLVELRMTGGNRDGRIRWGTVPLLPYVTALIEHRDEIRKSAGRVRAVAEAAKINPNYLSALAPLVSDSKHSPVLSQIALRLRVASERVRTERGTLESEAQAVTAEITQWQNRLLRLEDIGQLFKPGQVGVDPLLTTQEYRLPLSPAPGSESLTLSLVVHDSGLGEENAEVVWKNARLVSPEENLAPIALEDLRELAGRFLPFREKTLERTAAYLTAIAEASRQEAELVAADLAKKHDLDVERLVAWSEFVGIPLGKFEGGSNAPTRIEGVLQAKENRIAGSEWINGWGQGPPNVIANSSNDVEGRVPGTVPPRSIGVHPTPSHRVGLGWQSPISGVVKIGGLVRDAHTNCGNGVSWSIVFQRGTRQERLADGVVDIGRSLEIPVLENVAVRQGDVFSLQIGSRDRNHACDQTQVNLTIREKKPNGRVWDLAKDVSADLHAGNPHADGLGNERVWYFFAAPDESIEAGGSLLPGGSVLSAWSAAVEAKNVEEARRLALAAQELLTKGPNARSSEGDRRLYTQARSMSSVLFRRFDLAALRRRGDPVEGNVDSIGLAKERFRPEGDVSTLAVSSPSTTSVTIPSVLAEGRHLVVTAELSRSTTGSAQLEVLAGDHEARTGLRDGLPVFVSANETTRAALISAFDDFRALFPRVMCCRTIVPIDKVVTLVMYHREDDHFRRLLLDDAEREQLDRLWQELRFVSQDAIKIEEFYPLFVEFSTQGNDTHVFLPLEKPIRERADKFRALLKDTQPAQVDALIEFAARAFRRPLEDSEEWSLRALYAALRAEEESHEDAFRAVLARVFVSPAFLYRIETPGPGTQAAPVTSWELATRLSYFLWATTPDASLLDAARSAELVQPNRLVAEARRMLDDDRVRGLATEFACQWLGVRGFDTHDEKNERQYPSFAGLRDDMYEESIAFFTDLFRRDGSILEILDSDHTFLNESLAEHYGIAGIEGESWRRVDSMKERSRGGVLGMSSILSKQSGATRTSPVLRGNWVVETLLGEKLPDPPATVPELPDALSREGLTVRQMTERHVSDPSCSGCHSRIDPFGFALESFDAIGRYRVKDLVDKPVDTKVTLRDGTKFDGVRGLREYLSVERRRDFLAQFSRKLLGYALGRTVELHDQPLVDEMVRALEEKGYRFLAALEIILRSRQFRYHRGLEATHEESI